MCMRDILSILMCVPSRPSSYYKYNGFVIYSSSFIVDVGKFSLELLTPGPRHYPLSQHLRDTIFEAVVVPTIRVINTHKKFPTIT